MYQLTQKFQYAFFLQLVSVEYCNQIRSLEFEDTNSS